MLRSTKLVLVCFCAAALAACAPDSSTVHELQTQLTDTRPTPATPMALRDGTLVPLDQSKLESVLMGFLRADQTHIESDASGVRLKAILNFKAASGNILWTQTVATEGALLDFPTLLTLEGDNPRNVRIYALCLYRESEVCKGAIFDIYAEYGGRTHAVQLEAMSMSASSHSFVANASLAEPSEDEYEGVDSTATPSLYVGTLMNFDKGTPTAPPPTRDQVIGLANAGRLQRSSSLLEVVGAPGSLYGLVHPSRKRYWGSIEMMNILTTLGRKANDLSKSLFIGDISQKAGGKLVGTRHKSHQNGLDADIAYPSVRRPSTGSYINMVSGKGPSKDFLPHETWELFKTAWNTGMTDRIFVGSVLKRALCKHAKAKGEFAAYTQLLRYIRPEPGHNSHFHLRIKCSPNQPRCRMQGPPPASSGC